MLSRPESQSCPPWGHVPGSWTLGHWHLLLLRLVSSEQPGVQLAAVSSVPEPLLVPQPPVKTGSDEAGPPRVCSERPSFSLSFLTRDRHVWPSAPREPGAPAWDAASPCLRLRTSSRWPLSGRAPTPSSWKLTRLVMRGAVWGCSRCPFGSGIFADIDGSFPLAFPGLC